MISIGERISVVEDSQKTTVVILPKKQPWVVAVMGAWLGMWLCIGGVTIWSLNTLKLTGQEQVILWVFLSFWTYYAFKVVKAYLWLLWGQELMKIVDGALHMKRSVKNYGRTVPYYFENIKDFRYQVPEERSFQSVWESSPWIQSGERFSFEYFGKTIKFGKKLTQKEAHLLSQVIEKKMRKHSKK